MCDGEECAECDEEKIRQKKRDTTGIRLTILTGKMVAEAVEMGKDREIKDGEEGEKRTTRDGNKRYSNLCPLSVTSSIRVDLLGIRRVSTKFPHTQNRDHPRNSDSSKLGR